MKEEQKSELLKRIRKNAKEGLKIVEEKLKNANSDKEEISELLEFQKTLQRRNNTRSKKHFEGRCNSYWYVYGRWFMGGIAKTDILFTRGKRTRKRKIILNKTLTNRDENSSLFVFAVIS